MVPEAIVVRTTDEVPEQPLEFVIDTEKLPAVETLIDRVVAPVDQRYVDPAVDVKVMLPPEQTVNNPEIETLGLGLTVTVTLTELTQPKASVPVTV